MGKRARRGGRSAAAKQLRQALLSERSAAHRLRRAEEEAPDWGGASDSSEGVAASTGPLARHSGSTGACAAADSAAPGTTGSEAADSSATRAAAASAAPGLGGQ